ncbi:MAG: hypothetical protein HOP07_14835 [Bacteriovoracaceae bacterium]|nr:hypothetical protein [Bacteriovoracaceae bacterium]
MKHFLLATVLGISGKIYAEDNIDLKKVPTSQNETSQVKPISNVSDLMYFPSKGTFGGATKYSYASINQVLEYQSKEFTNTKIKTSSLEQTLGFAYDSKTLFGAILSYQLDSEASTSYGPGSTRNGQSAKNKSEKGLEDPTIFLSERIKFQETDNFNIDTTIRFSPKTGTAKSSTVAKEGNALRGANEFEFELNLGKKNEKSSWKAGLAYSLTGETKSEDAEVPADLTISESSNLYGLSFSYQWVVNNDFEVNLNTVVHKMV